MLNVSNLSEYRTELKKNRQIIQDILGNGSAYPALSKRLGAYNASLGRKLDSILCYAMKYGAEDEAQFISREQGVRGFECMLSFETMVKLYGGSVETWWRSIQMFATLGLLYIRKPDMHEPMSEDNPNGNTPAQEYSRERARIKAKKDKPGIKPVNWYSFPRYTKGVLAEAEKRAEALKGLSIGSINKDAVRDRLEARIADTAYDTPFGISDHVQAYRGVIRSVIQAQLSQHGYTSPEAVLKEAYQQIAGEDMAEADAAKTAEPEDIWDGAFDADKAKQEARIRATLKRIWGAYRPQLFIELGLMYSAPTKEEMEAFQFQSKGWIIRRR